MKQRMPNYLPISPMTVAELENQAILPPSVVKTEEQSILQPPVAKSLDAIVQLPVAQ
ncbi:MAG: hypothetical protein NTX61_08720 [Bacteroidetes bacterium]|nr:hypothetical protein [Bacteroidota bacterium]